ncbi:DNA mismatch repair protein Mlh1, partial [Operophtera brumata]
IRKAVDSIYSTYLPKNSHAFVYLSLQLDPKNVDVNVHPTKHEVQFLYEEQIIEKIKSCIESKLLSCNSTRVLYTQTTEGAGSRVYANSMVRVDADLQKIDKFFPAITKVTENNNNRSERIKITHTEANDVTEQNNHTKRVELTDNGKENDETDQINYAKRIEYTRNGTVNGGDGTDKINRSKRIEFTRNDTENEKTDIVNEAFNKITDLPTDVEMTEADIINETEHINSSIVQEPKDTNKITDRWKINSDQGNLSYIDPKESFKTRKFQYERVETKLTSIKQLRLDIENSCNMNLREILANLIFIACIDCHKSLIQHSTKLYLCDTTKLTVYRLPQNFGLMKLSNPLPLEELFVLGLSAQESEWNPELGKLWSDEAVQSSAFGRAVCARSRCAGVGMEP